MTSCTAHPPAHPDDPLAGGLVDEKFEPVRRVFDRIAAERPGANLALCVYRDGRPVVDLWTGPAYSAHRGDALQLSFSATKGMSAMCVAVLTDRGLLDPDAPVAEYWPEFAAAGKARTTVAQLLSHRAGLPTVDGGFTVDEALAHDALAERLVAQEPYWEPGTAHGYHSVTYGTLVEELVRRVTGTRLGDFFAERVAAPVGADAWIGLPAEQDHRCVPLVPPEHPEVPVPDSLSVRTFPKDWSPSTGNSPRVRATGQGAFTGTCSARGLARLYAACIGRVDGVRLLSTAAAARAAEPVAVGHDLVNLEPSAFGLGFQVPFARLPLGGPGSFGHDGMGGVLGFAAPEQGYSFAFLTDRMPDRGGADPCTNDLIAATENSEART